MNNKLTFFKTCMSHGARFLAYDEMDDDNYYYQKLKPERQRQIDVQNFLKDFPRIVLTSFAVGVHKDLLSEHKYQLIFSKTWTTGGASGGNCYGDDAEWFDGEIEPNDFEGFENWKKQHYPEIPSEKIINQLQVKNYTHSNVEYYGNYTNYQTAYFFISDLYRIIQQLKLDNDLDKKNNRKPRF